MQSNSHIQLSFIAAACNRDTNCVDWMDVCDNSLIAYGSSSLVCIFSPQCVGVLCSLRGHSSGVTCVRFVRDHLQLQQQQDTCEIVSASVDQTIKVWQYNFNSNQYCLSSSLSGHTAGVTALAVLKLKHATIMATTATDHSLRIWRREHSSPLAPSSEWSCIQVLPLGLHVIMHTCDLVYVPPIAGNNGLILLSLGGVDTLLHVYMSDAVECVFASAVELQGHERWVTSVEWATINTSQHRHEQHTTHTLMLASASQDKTIRVWKVHVGDSCVVRRSGSSLLSSDASSAAHMSTTSLGSRGHIVKYCGVELMFVLESVLSGHDNWVMSARWQPQIKQGGVYVQPLCLLSSSTDKTMMIWQPDPIHHIWSHVIRVGEMGGHTLGFYGARFSPDGKKIIANGYSGCFHYWTNDNPQDVSGWQCCVIVSGHAGSVNDVCWDADGDYFISTSSDQTTRIYAPWCKNNNNNNKHLYPTFHEIARPQIHGYDLNCLTPIPNKSHEFASGADEKVIRVFYAPQPFLHTLHNISGVEPVADNNLSHIVNSPASLFASDHDHRRAVRANLPELGLSNKALMEGDQDFNRRGMESVQSLVQLTAAHQSPGVEDELISSTLWPEVEKLYGHGFEVIAMCASHNGAILAAACVAKKQQHAVIRVWETREWKEILQLEAHRSTVVQLQFSHDDRFLLSVSRDRHLALFSFSFPLDSSSPLTSDIHVHTLKVKAHARIVWSCSWAPTLYDGKYVFATASRDKTVKLWSVTPSLSDSVAPSLIELCTLPSFAVGVTAVAFLPTPPLAGTAPPLVMAIGFEDGNMQLWKHANKQINEHQWSCLDTIPLNDCPGDVVKRLVWRWRVTSYSLIDETTRLPHAELLVASQDHSIRMFIISPAILMKT